MLLYDQNLSQAVATAAAVPYIYVQWIHFLGKNLKEMTKLNYVYFYEINKRWKIKEKYKRKTATS